MELSRHTPLQLRHWHIGDRSAVLDALASPDMDRQFPPGDTAEARAEQWLGWAAGLTARPAGYAFAVCAGDDVPLGNVAVTSIDSHDVGWVSYWTSGRARGFGIASDALAALVPWLHDEAGIWRLELGHRLNNPASARVAERAGFVREGTERAKLKYDGHRFDTARWARLADDLRPRVERPIDWLPSPAVPQEHPYRPTATPREREPPETPSAFPTNNGTGFSIIVAAFLGSSMVIGIWANHSGIFSFIGFVAAAFSTAMAVVNILARQADFAKQENDLLNLHHERTQLAARNAVQQEESLRIYRINIRATMDRYRSEASQNRRVGNTLQWFIIIGAVVAASSTSAAAAAISSMTWFKWLAASMSMIVAIASSATGFFKFRERSVAKQQTADAIARESQAMELGIRDYKDLEEKERLTLFAERVEDIVEEQRKRELQLEESSREGESKDAR